MKLEFRDLKYFQIIAEEGHIGRAAERLFRTQPALTKCVHRLEETIGAKLFERDGRGIRLTGVGAVLLARTRQMGVMLDETTREIADYGRGIKGHIRLGCVPTLAEHLLPGISQELLAQAPEVTIHLMVAMNDAVLDALANGELDLVVGPVTEVGQAFETERFLEDEVVVMASKNHEIFKRDYTIADLTEFRWVLPAQTVATRQWLDQTFERHGLPRPQVQIEPNVLNMILPLIEKTHLLGFTTKLNLKSGKVKLREVSLQETTMQRRFGITYRKGAYLAPAVQRLVTLLRERGEVLFV